MKQDARVTSTFEPWRPGLFPPFPLDDQVIVGEFVSRRQPTPLLPGDAAEAIADGEDVVRIIVFVVVEISIKPAEILAVECEHGRAGANAGNLTRERGNLGRIGKADQRENQERNRAPERSIARLIRSERDEALARPTRKRIGLSPLTTSRDDGPLPVTFAADECEHPGCGTDLRS